MSENLKAGEKVDFNIGRNLNPGIIKEKITEDKQVGGRVVHASEDNPQYLIEHENTGKIQSRHPEKVHQKEQESSGKSGMSK